MGAYNRLYSEIKNKRSFLCIGLDPDLSRLPSHLSPSASDVVDFCKEIIDKTHDLCVAYKPNLAFFEVMGVEGWEAFRQIVQYIPQECLVLADAKRGDIGNSSAQYARAFFETMACDAITVAPYMGRDSLQAFLEYKDKWTVILALTSNQGSDDFQQKVLKSGERLFERVLETTSSWGTKDNTMYVIGATHPKDFKTVREKIPEHFLLVPGVGAQGATVADVCRYGLNDHVGLLINSSRSIIFASSGEDFASRAREEALDLVRQMREATDL